MAKKKKKKKKKKEKVHSSTAQGEGAPSVSEVTPPLADGSGGSGRAHWWATYRGPLVGALAAVVFAGLWGPTRSWIDGATDSVHDLAVYFVDFDGGRVDDMKERIRDRPFWEDSPSFKDRSLHFVADHLDGEPISTLRTDSTSAEILTVDELVEGAANLDGDPVVVIGKFVSNTLLGGDSLTLDREETIVSGNDFYIYVANGAGFKNMDQGGYENLVAAQGVLVATGRAKASNDPDGVETAYFTALERIPVNPRNPDIRPQIEALTEAGHRQGALRG